MITERHFFGEWRQIEPPTEPEAVFIEFEPGGRLTYTVEGPTTQQILLTWTLNGDTLETNQPSHPRLDSIKYRFESPSRLILERSDGTYILERC